MSIAQLGGVVSARRAGWRDQVEEAKQDMGLLEKNGAAGETTRRPFEALLKPWNSLKAEKPVAFADLVRRTGT